MPSNSQLSLPNRLLEVLTCYDSRTDDFDVAEVGDILERELGLCGEVDKCEKKASFAEISALQMPLVAGHERSKWGTRFGPVFESTLEDGTLYSFPDLANIDLEVVEYWEKRSQESQHPVFRARYADLVWDMTKAATGEKPPFPLALRAIDAYVECGTRFCYNDAEDRLERALELSLSVREKVRAESVVSAMFKVVDSTKHPGSRLLWLFDLPYRMAGVRFTGEQEGKVIQGLEKELQRICSSENPIGLVAKEPALRLAAYYEKSGAVDDAKRVIRSYGEALSRFAVKARGLIGMHWFQEAYGIYLKYGIKEEAEKFQIAAKKKGEESKGEMVRHSQSFGIPGDEMDVFLEEITSGGLESATAKIVIDLLPKRDDILKQLQATRQKAKLLAMSPVEKIGENQVIARAGSIEDDPEGRMMFQMADFMKYTAIFLGKALDHARERYEFTSCTILPILYQSPLFDPARTMLMEQGIDAYLGGDHVKAIHVLMPQIEHSLRRLLPMLGVPTNKHRRSDLGVMIEKSLNDILECEPLVQQCLGDDVTFYLRTLLCDPRGFNVRNDLAHGLMAPGNFNRFVSDRLIHVVFLLSQLQGESPT